MKLVVLTTMLTPYLLPLFRELDRRVERLDVLLMTERAEDRHWRLEASGVSSRVLPGLHVRPPGRSVSVHFNYRVVATLRALDPDVVVSGGFAPANLAALVYCKIHRKRFVGWGELTWRHDVQTSRVKQWIRRWSAAWSDGAIASSGEAREAFRHYGINADRILTAVMPVDVDHFHSGADAFRRTEDFGNLKRRYPGPVLLSVGQIIPRKGYAEMFAIYRRLLDAGYEPTLLILGEGPDRAQFEALARRRGWDRVQFQGFVPPEDLPKWFALADVFIFHTLFDPFGAVLAEAMAAGLPVVSSTHAAATHELVVDGANGFRIDPKDAEASAAAIIKVLTMSAEERRVMGGEAYATVRRHDPSASADAIVWFLRSILDTPTRRTRHSADEGCAVPHA
jgi:glycosyltransferase involved in cell wall biosynthesis